MAAASGHVMADRRRFPRLVVMTLVVMIEKVVVMVVVAVMVFAVTAALVVVLQIRLHELVARGHIVLDGRVGVAHRGAQLGDCVPVT